MQGVRIYEIPDCKMISSGIGMFGEEKFDLFSQWLSQQPRGIFPRDYLFYDKADGKEGFHWLYIYENGMTLPDKAEIIDFKGGLYAVASDIDGRTDKAQLDAEVRNFLAENGFETDPSRQELGNVITPPAAQKILGYSQMDYFTPIKAASV